MIEYEVFGDEYRRSTKMIDEKEDLITKTIIDVIRSFPLSDESYRRIQIEIQEKWKQKKWNESIHHQPEHILDRQFAYQIKTGSMKPIERFIEKDFISEDEMEIPLED